MLLTEERQELMRIGRELIATLNEHIALGRAHNARVNIVINKLIGEADAMKLAVLDGQATEPPKVQAITFSSPLLATPEEVRVALAPGKRACSLCREPGHRATNCPNAHKIQAVKKAEVAARPVKKSRAPLSPERKAQLAKTLEKARAARKAGTK